MSKVEFDSKGNPSFYIGSQKIIAFVNPEEIPNIDHNTDIEPLDIGGYKIIPWFDDNNFPKAADDLIKDNPVLKRALATVSKVILGQGIFPARILEVDANGKETLEVVNEPEITTLFQSYLIRRYLARTAYFLNSLGNAFVQLIPNMTGDKILRVVPVNAKHCRVEAADNKGDVNRVFVSGKFPDAEKKDIKPYILLDESDPYAHLELLKEAGTLKKESVFMQLKTDFTFNDFYAMPEWYAAHKWVGISNKVPDMIDAGMDNMLGILFHIQIPYSYWEKKYPKDSYDGKLNERQKYVL